MNCFVTGATGFIGSNLLEALVRQGHYVRCFINTKGRKLPEQYSNVDVCVGDLRDKNTLVGILNGVDVVFHCAGLLGAFDKRKKDYYELNVLGTENILTQSVASSVKKFIYISSAGVSGPTLGFTGDEFSKCFPSNLYEHSKYMVEAKVVNSGLDYVIIRPEFVYGPGDMHVLELFRHIQRRVFFMISGGRSLLQPTYISDVINALLASLRPDIRNQIYIIAGKEYVTVKKLVETIANEMDVDLLCPNIPKWLAYVIAFPVEYLCRVFSRKPLVTRQRIKFSTQNRIYNITKAKQELGFAPEYSLKEGVRSTVSFYKKTGLLT